MWPFTKTAVSLQPHNDDDLEAPLLEEPQPQKHDDDDDDDAVTVHEVHMVCFTPVNHHDCDYQPSSMWCSAAEGRRRSTVLYDLAVSLVLPVLLAVQFYLAYQQSTPEKTVAEDTGLSLREAWTVLGLYTLACLSYRFSCSDDNEYDDSKDEMCGSTLLYLLPELVSDGIALLLLLHSTALALSVTSLFAIAFAVAAVLNTMPSLNIIKVRVAVVDEEEEEAEEQDGLDVTHHDRTKLFLQPTTV